MRGGRCSLRMSAIVFVNSVEMLTENDDPLVSCKLSGDSELTISSCFCCEIDNDGARLHC